MTECEVVRRAGAVEKMELAADEGGERVLVLTYLHGPWPGIYRFRLCYGNEVLLERPIVFRLRRSTLEAQMPSDK